ncbi:hypothetical protein [Streptomyces violaceorubidus]|uniref:hypothetical protein n=1 Tax=Streptomyces violaceorubidus TaxID=284042 RepID=UPI000A83AC96|nr:hypothetical protein [Streptomyces violaceorubidus]
MSPRHTITEPRTGTPSAAPRRATPLAPAVQPVITAPGWPSRWHLITPAKARNTAAALSSMERK